MPRSILSSALWTATLGRKLIICCPGGTAAVIASTLVSQLSSVAASFLPLKVLILLGSPEIPTYFPAFISRLDRDQLIIGLSLMACAFFGLHLISDRISKLTCRVAAQIATRKNGKENLSRKQSKAALQGYKTFSLALASLIFIALSIFALQWLYPTLAWLVVTYIIVALMLTCALASWPPLAQRMAGERLGSLVKAWAGLGFLLGFGAMVIDFLSQPPQGLTQAIIALLLLRQVFRNLETLFVNLARLNRTSVNLSTLYLSDTAPQS